MTRISRPVAAPEPRPGAAKPDAPKAGATSPAAPFGEASSFDAPGGGFDQWVGQQLGFGPEQTPLNVGTERYAGSAQDLAAVQKAHPDVGTSPARSSAATAAAYGMLARLHRLSRDGRGATVGGVSAEDVLMRGVINNPRVSDAMLLRMGSVTVNQIAPGPAVRADIEARSPGSRALDSHKMAVAMLSATTGISPYELSAQSPDLGLSGTPDTPIGLRAPTTTGDNLTTGLHDFTDSLTDAGVAGMDNAFWGTDGKTLSALRSFSPLDSAQGAWSEILGRIRGR